MENINQTAKDKKIKILELCDAFYPTVDGVVAVVKNYAQNLNKMEECSVAAPSAKKSDGYVDAEEFAVLRCLAMGAPEKYRMAYPMLDKKFIDKIEGENFDILHVHSPFSLGRFAVKTSKRQKIPLVATLHTQYHKDFERVLKGNKLLVRFMIKYIMKVFNKADSVWTVSEASKRYLRLYGYKGDIEVVRNGTDYVYPDNPEELVASINKEYNLEGQKNVFLFVGRMAMYKNLKLICDALKIIKDKGVDFKMLFVGGGFDVEELIEYAKSLGLEENCIFTGNVSDRKKLQAFYLRGDVYLFPSTFDMASVSKVEAAAHKLPSVVVRNSCSAEQVEDGENGFLIEEYAEDFAEKLLYLVENPEVVKRAGEKAYETLYRSWEDVAKEALEKYKKIIEEYKNNPRNKKKKC